MKVFSFCLYGNNPIYTIGAIKNLKLINKLFPDWKTIVSHADNVDKEVLNQLNNEGAILIEKDHRLSFTGMFWRFLPISFDYVDIMVSRDCDSRVSERDVKCIDEFINSKFNYNIVRDHPIGHRWNINGGMWGAKKTDYIGKINDYVNDYLREKSEAGENGYWMNLAIPDMRRSSMERENERMFKYNQSYLETLYNDESRYFEWLEYFDYIINFCKANDIKLKCFFMHNSFSSQYDYGLMPGNYKDGNAMVKGIFEDRNILNTWEETQFRIESYPYTKYLYNSIDWDKYCCLFEEEGLHTKGGVFEWEIRNQVKSTPTKFNPLFMEFELYKSQSKLEEALKKGEMGWTGHISSCNYKKFTEEVILKWDMFK